MENKLLITAALVALLGAGCQQQTEPAPDRSQQEAPAKVAAENADKTDASQPLPEGVQLDFPYRVASDRIVERDNGRDRRKITIQYLEADAQQVVSSIDASMLAAGFQGSARKDLKDDGVRLRYRKAKVGSVVVTVKPKAEAGDEDAVQGRVIFDWPQQPAQDGQDR